MGRPKGSLNRDTHWNQAKAAELGVDPFIILLYFAAGDWKSLGYESAHELKMGKGGEVYPVDRISAQIRMSAASDACAYLYPKRKAIDVTVKTKKARPLKDLSDEDLSKLEIPTE